MTDAPTERVEAGIFAKLRQRKVVQWSVAYAAGAWGLLQGLGYVSGLYDWPRQFQQVALLVFVLGFPIALTLAWYHGDRGEQRVGRTELAILTLLFLLGGSLFWRYQHTLATASVATPAPAGVAVATDRSIAVLPFVNMSADKEQEYFADGISEELLNLLAQVSGLRVIARTSSFSFKGKDLDIAEIARRLNVAHVLEGSVRRSGDTLRITAQLIRASDSSHLWSQTYDRPVTDVFAVQDEIAAAVVNQLKATLLGGALNKRTTDPEAYARFLQAREITRHHGIAPFEQAIALYKQALAIDPNFAPAWDGLAETYFYQIDYGALTTDDGLPLVREAMGRALATDPLYAPAYAHAALVEALLQNDLPSAARHIEQGLALDPANLDVITVAARIATRLNRPAQAVALAEYAVMRDPVNVVSHENLALARNRSGQFDQAVTQLRTALKFSPEAVSVHEHIGELLLLKGEHEAALAEMKQEPSEHWRLLGLSLAYHAIGRKAASDAALNELVRKYGQIMAANIAYTYAWRGEVDDAFAWLEKAVRYHDPGVGSTGVDQMFASLHSDPRWLPFLRKLGVAPEQLAAIKFDVKVPN